MTDLASLNQRHSQAAQQYIAADNAFANKVILVTGAGDGIGRALALGLASKGATVVLLGRTQKNSMLFMTKLKRLVTLRLPLCHSI